MRIMLGMRDRAVRPAAAAALVAALAVGLPACAVRTVVREVTPSSPQPRSGLPPVPSLPRESAGPGEPQLVWIGGTLSRVDAAHIVVTEAAGPVVTLTRLAQGATAFFRASGGAWRRLTDQAPVEAGQLACVQTLMDGSNLLAIRVFLGADCGPA